MQYLLRHFLDPLEHAAVNHEKAATTNNKPQHHHVKSQVQFRHRMATVRAAEANENQETDRRMTRRIVRLHMQATPP